MQSTFSGIEIGKKSIMAHSKAISTVGHNVSNASVEGYSRQRVKMGATNPLYYPHLNRENTPGQLGQGVEVTSVERVEDVLLEGRIIGRTHRVGYWEERDKYMLQVERVFNEPEGGSSRELMDGFWSSWQTLAKDPDSIAKRQLVRESGEALIDSINESFKQLKTVRGMLDTEVQVATDKINSITKDITELNKEIVKVEAVGDNPNDLYDKRDLLVRELGELINIETDGRDPDEFNIHTGGRHLVQGKIAFNLELRDNPLNEGYRDVVWSENGEALKIAGGKLKAFVELRDEDLRKEISKLDNMTMNFVDLVNESHRKAYNLQGENGLNFFNEYAFVNNVDGNFDSNGDGEFDTTRIFRITGSNKLQAKQQVGFQGTLTLAGQDENVQIAYNATDTVDDIIKKINLSGSEVVARLDSDGKLQLKAVNSANMENPDFVIRHIEDDGEFLTNYAGILAASGAEGAFTWNQANSVASLNNANTTYSTAPLAHPSGWVEVNDAITRDASKIATGFGVNGRVAEKGDSSAALAIASIRNNEVMVGRMGSFDRFFADQIADVGVRGMVAQEKNQNEKLVMKELNDMKLAITGVNIDEELTDLIKFQHGYAAGARFITEFDKMLDIIINRLGV